MISTNGSDSDGEIQGKPSEVRKYDKIEFENMSKGIKKEEIESFFKSKNISYKEIEFYSQEESSLQTVRVLVEGDPLTYTKLEVLKKETFPGHQEQKIQINYLLTIEDGLTINKPKEDDRIEYSYEYHKMIHRDFERKEGSEGLVFKNKEIIAKQRAVMGYLFKKMGSNLLSGKSIMNVSLPINIFDVRSHLEVFLSQTCYAPIFLENAGITENPLESLKLTTTFALTTVHLAVAQLKPFNPILGETFQTKIGDSKFYIEQTSHHPPIFNFLFVGTNYKVYGWNESEVLSGANSIKAKYKGSYTVKFSNGRELKVYFPLFKLSGTLFGNRSIKYSGNLVVTDEKSDLIACLEMDPHDKGFFKKIFSKKKSTFPDYFKGAITCMSENSKFDKKEKSYSIVDFNKSVISTVEGEFSKFINFDGVNYWDYDKYAYPLFKRDSFTLPSDSTFREDINWLKDGDEGMAQKAKIKLEDIQRKDKKLRLKK